MMQELRLHILEEAEKRATQQLVLVSQARENCINISNQLQATGKCTCRYESWGIKSKRKVKSKVICKRCQLKDELAKITISPIFERPLPNEEHLQNAVIFEIMIPDEISDFRDCLALLTFGLIEKPVKKNDISLEWSRYKNLLDYVPSNLLEDLRPRVIRFGSKCLNVAATCYEGRKEANVMLLKDEQFITDNGLQCFYSYEFSTKMVHHYVEKQQINNKRKKNPKPKNSNRTQITPLQKLKQRSSFHLLSTAKSAPYIDLQEYLESYNHSQNEVMANQSNCHSDLPCSEYLAFASLRAGHHLQIKNLYRAIHCKELQLEEEPVLALILQTIWQLGPSAGEFGRESHFDFEGDNFAQLFIEMLANLIKENESDYSKPLTLMAAVIITVRIMELNEKVFDFGYYKALQPFRFLIRHWSKKIKIKIAHEQNPENLKELTRLLLLIRLSSALSYNFSENIHWTKVIRNNEDYVEYLHTISILNEKDKDSSIPSLELSRFMRILLDTGRNVPLRLRLELEAFNSIKTYESLVLFVQEKWDKAKDFTVSPCLTKLILNEQIDHVILIMLEKFSPEVNVWIMYDFIQGTFLVDGQPQTQLPLEVKRAPLFQRYFGKNIHFLVQPEANGVMRTVTKFHKKYYEFICVQNNSYLIKEISEDRTALTLLNPEIFSGLVSENLVNNYSHWLDWKKENVYFRKLPVREEDYELPHEYTFFKKAPNSPNWCLARKNTKEFILSVNSDGFKNLSEALTGIDVSENIVVQMNRMTKTVTAFLPRHNLSFAVDKEKLKLMSLDYPGYQVTKAYADETLIGLKNKIILRNKKSGKQIVLVPHGNIKWTEEKTTFEVRQDKKTTDVVHYHATEIDLEVLRTPPYFVYEFDPVLKRLVANKSESAWLYLAALHAVTSTPIADTFTQITGTEMAVRILQSGYLWSGRPYDEESLKTLEFIKSLSPKRYYYGSKLIGGEEGSVEVIEWPEGLPSMAAFDGFGLIVDKLIEESGSLNGLHYAKKDLKEDEKVEGDMKTSGKLILRSYFRFKSFYNDATAVEKKYFNSSYLGLLKNGNQAVQLECSRNKGFSLDFLVKIAATRSTSMKEEGWKYFQKNSLVPFLTYPNYEPLQCSSSLPSLNAIMHMDLKENWMKIYEFAREKEKSDEDKHQLDLILCAMAYKKESLEQVMNLHIISVFPAAFPQAPDCSDGAGRIDADLDKFIQNVLVNAINFEDVHKELKMSSAIFLHSRKSTISTLVQLIRMWLWPDPVNEIDSDATKLIRSHLSHILVDYYNIQDLVDDLELEWEERNREPKGIFDKFVDEVQGKLNEIWDSFRDTPETNGEVKSNNFRTVAELNIKKLEWKKGIQLEDVIILEDTEAIKIIHDFNKSKNSNNSNEGSRAIVAEMLKVEQLLEKILRENEEGEILYYAGLSVRIDPTSLLRKLVQLPKGNLTSLIEYLGNRIWRKLKELDCHQLYKANGEISEMEGE